MNVEGWKVGRSIGWTIGRLEDWKVGRLEDWKVHWVDLKVRKEVLIEERRERK